MPRGLTRAETTRSPSPTAERVCHLPLYHRIYKPLYHFRIGEGQSLHVVYGGSGVRPLGSSPQSLFRKNLPNPHGLVVRPGKRQPPVRRKSHAPDSTSMTLKRTQISARGHLPHPKGLIPGPGERQPPVRRKRHAERRVEVPWEAHFAPGGGHAPPHSSNTGR